MLFGHVESVWSCRQGYKEYDPSQGTIATFPLWGPLDFPALAIFVGPHLQGMESWVCYIHGAGPFWVMESERSL